VASWCFSRNGEVIGSRSDFKMNTVAVDLATGFVMLDAQSQSIINLPAMQQQQQQTRDAIS